MIDPKTLKAGDTGILQMPFKVRDNYDVLQIHCGSITFPRNMPCPPFEIISVDKREIKVGDKVRDTSMRIYQTGEVLMIYSDRAWVVWSMYGPTTSYIKHLELIND